MRRRPGYLPPANHVPTGAAPTRRIVRQEVKRFRDVDFQGEFYHQITTDYLSCGHVASGKPRKDGRYPCYECRDKQVRP